MGDIVPPQAGIHQAFAVADTTISQSVRSIVNLIQRPGLIHIGFDDLLAALRSRNGRCLFGFGESDSDNRAHEALTQALKNPLMDRGRMLEEAARVLVQVAGGPGMTLSEVEILMQELGRNVSEQTQILFGAAVDGRLGDRLTVTIISSLTADEDLIPQSRDCGAVSNVPAKLPVWEQPQEIAPKVEIDPELTPMEVSESMDVIPLEEPAPVETAPPPAVEPVLSKPEPIAGTPHKTPGKEAKPSAEKSVQAKQEVLQFETVTRGRFEKSEPTIVEGEDLDVPTYLRKHIKVK
jgi:cell division protein FtsZ